MGDIIKLTSFQMDALKEAVNIGAGNAASSLSKIASSRVFMSVPKATIVPVEKIQSFVTTNKEGELLIRVNIMGDAPGSILICIPMSSACLLSDIMMERKAGETKTLSAMDISAIQEVGNIMTGSYLGALETFMGVPFRSSVPFLAIDKKGDVLKATIAELGQTSDYALVIESDVKEKDHHIQIEFFLLPNPESLMKMLKVLGVD